MPPRPGARSHAASSSSTRSSAPCWSAPHASGSARSFAESPRSQDAATVIGRLSSVPAAGAAASCASCARRQGNKWSASWTTIRNCRGDDCRESPCSGGPERSRASSRAPSPTPSSSRFPTPHANASAWSSMPARLRRCPAASSVATLTSILTPSSARPPTELTMTVVTARTTPAEQTLADRLLAAVPLLSIFLWLAIVYVIQAWAHKTPWLFGDELELTQLSRAIADTGHAARRGAPYSFTTLWTYVLAPAWLIDNLHAAYATVKYLTVIVMTATVFPAYGIARLFVGRRPALFVAAASAAIPALAYSSMIVEEPFAYFWSTLALFLILRALITPSPRWIGGAVVASLVAPLVRGELAMISVVFLLAGTFLLWRSEYACRWRRGWLGRDWVGFAILVVGAVVIVSAV